MINDLVSAILSVAQAIRDKYPRPDDAGKSSFDYVASGGIWSGDSYGGNKNASMTAGIIYINRVPLTLAVVTARVFTASKDTYVDATDNKDGTALLTYTEVANNAASPALATGAVRLAIIITGASNIANAAAINQGQTDRLLPIVSSIPYTFTDSLGNIIFPLDPYRKRIGYRRAIASIATTSGTQVQGGILSVPIKVDNYTRVKARLVPSYLNNTSANCYAQIGVWLGVVASGTQLGGTTAQVSIASQPIPGIAEGDTELTTGSYTFNAGINQLGGGTAQMVSGGAVNPTFLEVLRA